MRTLESEVKEMRGHIKRVVEEHVQKIQRTHNFRIVEITISVDESPVPVVADVKITWEV